MTSVRASFSILYDQQRGFKTNIEIHHRTHNIQIHSQHDIIIKALET